MLKNKKKRRVLISVIILLALIFIGSFFFLRGNDNKNRFFLLYYYKLRFLMPFNKEPREKDIYTAIEKRDYESVEALLKQNNNIFDVKCRIPYNDYNSTLKSGDEKIILMFLAAGVKPGYLMNQAIRENQTDTVKLLVECGANIEDEGTEFLSVASEYGRKEIVSYLVSKGVKGDGKNGIIETPLHIAAKQGGRPLLFDVPIGGLPEFPVCEIGDYLEITKILIKNGADVHARDIDGQTPLHCAAEQGPCGTGNYGVFNTGKYFTSKNSIMDENVEIMKLLLENGADINAEDGKGLTPIILAVRSGNHKSANFLLSKGAKLSNRVIEKQRGSYNLIHGHGSLLSFASAAGLYKVAKELLKDKNNNRDKDPETGLTPLHYASSIAYIFFDTSDDYVSIKHRKLKIAKLLVAGGYNVNAKAKWVATPLHAAVHCKFPEMAEFLISKGADVNVKDDEGKTPLDIARENGSYQITKILQKHNTR